MRILIVDDARIMLEVTSHILKQIGFEDVVQADDGKSALEMLQDSTFDLVITDWYMPKVDGLDLLKRIRSGKKTSNIPVLMVTSESAQPQILRAVAAGVTSYIVKPFTPATLQNKIETILPMQ